MAWSHILCLMVLCFYRMCKQKRKTKRIIFCIDAPGATEAPSVAVFTVNNVSV